MHWGLLHCHNARAGSSQSPLSILHSAEACELMKKDTPCPHNTLHLYEVIENLVVNAERYAIRRDPVWTDCRQLYVAAPLAVAVQLLLWKLECRAVRQRGWSISCRSCLDMPPHKERTVTTLLIFQRMPPLNVAVQAGVMRKTKSRHAARTKTLHWSDVVSAKVGDQKGTQG